LLKYWLKKRKGDVMDSDRKLVNFRVPEDLVEMFEESWVSNLKGVR
jgi:glutathionylspermidine synthase